MHAPAGRRCHECGEGDPKPPALLPLPLPARTPTPPTRPPSSPPHSIPQLYFRGLSPGPRWSSWVASALRDSAFTPALISAAISDAVAASTAAVVLDRPALFALLTLWDPATHAFLLPGGPATFSLEDGLVLAGLPPSGAALDRPLTPEEDDLRIRLVVEKEKIRELHACARAERRVSAKVWLEWFESVIRPGEDDELRRLGFLAYWLAFFVTPRLQHKSGELPERVFALAARLSLGERIALGPATVANLYADMDRVVASAAAEGSSSRVDVWAPFWMLQVWMWERYRQLRPPPLKAPPFPISGVRVLYWSGRKSTNTLEGAHRILQDEACFDWRPYLHNSSRWMEPKWFTEGTFLVSCTGKDKPEWIADYIALISQTVLTGWYGDDKDTSVLYNPQLVARQFGYDQVVPVFSAKDFATMPNEVWIPSVGRHGMASDEFVACYRNGQLDRYQDADQYDCSVAQGHENGASLLVLKSNKENAVEEAALNLSDGSIMRESKKYIGDGQLAQLPNGAEGDETKVVLGLCACDNVCNTTVVKQRKQKRKRDKFAENRASKKSKAMVKNTSQNTIVQEEGQKYSSVQADINASSKRCDTLPQFDSDDDCIILEPCEKECDVINIDDEEQSPLDPECHYKQLVLELDEFVRSGLLSQWEESSDEDEENGRKRVTLKTSCKDPYAEAAMREYPLFFEFIPQKPHYSGFLEDKVIGDLAYSGLWFLLISLAKEVLKTTCDTDVSEIAYLMKKAKHLEQLGFNVKHFIARLKEPQIRLERLQDSMEKLEDARKKEQDERGVKSLSSHLSKLKHNIRKMERHLDEKNQAFISSAHDKLNEAIDLVSLEKEVEAAGKYCQAMKDEVVSMRTNCSDV